MLHNDDIAFQRAILANPADTTLKLVYADWLQERGDPRAEFVRLQVELNEMVESESTAQATGWLGKMGSNLDPKWVTFMSTLAQPCEPFAVRTSADPFGRQGVIATSLFNRFVADWDDGLLADLEFLVNVPWGVSVYNIDAYYPISPFLCHLPDEKQLTEREIRAALNISAMPQSADHNTERCWVHTDFRVQEMFDARENCDETMGAHGTLKRHVVNGQLWYVYLPIHTTAGFGSSAILLTVGRSPNGNRLVGAFAFSDSYG